MGRDLMHLDIFEDSIMKSNSILERQGINLYDIIMSEDENIFNEVLNSFVGIAAMQVKSLYARDIIYGIMENQLTPLLSTFD